MHNLHLNQYPLISIIGKKNKMETYERNALLSKAFIIKDNTNLIITPHKEKLNHIFSTNHTNKKKNGFLLEILFIGLNFYAKRLKLNRYRYKIDVHKSEIYIIKEQVAKAYKLRIHKRRLIFFSYDRHLLSNISKTIKGIKAPDIYTTKGLYPRTGPFRVKKGKVRKK